MGADFLTTLFIGRPCTKEEAAFYFEQLKDMYIDQSDAGRLFDFGGDDPMFKTAEGSVILYAYGWSSGRIDWVLKEKGLQWFVVGRFLKTTSHRDPIEPIKPRHGLIMVHDVSQ